MAQSLYNTKAFKIIDGVLFYIGEFLLWLIIFAPIISLLYGFVFEVDGTLQYKIDRILHAFDNYSLPAAIIFIAFIRSIITMTINTNLLVLICIMSFFIAIYIGFGLITLIFIFAVALILFLLNRINLIHNFVVDKLNNFFKLWKLYKMKKENVRESIFSEPLNDMKHNEAPYQILSFVGIAILVILALILFWEIWVVLHMKINF
ncbi:MAG: hypothetical protein N3E50_04045 [Candidatus Goldbacteria bacterium]|nr:hypothetical protein [Candidatus Goldiibacteriota bacterium]